MGKDGGMVFALPRPEGQGIVAAYDGCFAVRRSRALRAGFQYLALKGGASFCSLTLCPMPLAVPLFLPCPSRRIGTRRIEHE